MQPLVLVVDDEPLQRNILKTILSEEGYETYAASSGEEALKRVRDIRPDLVLMDIVLKVDYYDERRFATAAAEKALQMIRSQMEEPEMGKIYKIVPDSYARGRIDAQNNSQMEFHVAGELASIVMPLVDRVLAAGAKLTGIWTQDWTGVRIFWQGKRLFWNWVVNPELYPGLREEIRQRREQGIRWLAYANPYFNIESDYFRLSRERGYLLREPRKTFRFTVATTF
mgnify:CR=1 FL=1